MTITYCDLCGKALNKGEIGCAVRISEYKAEACDDCAHKLINHCRTGPYKGGQKKES